MRNLEVGLGSIFVTPDVNGGDLDRVAAVVVWRIADTAQAAFDVENYEAYVRIQSETAVRHLANSYAYDHGEEITPPGAISTSHVGGEPAEITLRSGVDEVSAALRAELQERLSKSGVEVEEARLT